MICQYPLSLLTSTFTIAESLPSFEFQSVQHTGSAP